MDWLLETILEPSAVQAIILISLVSALGLQLGKLKILNISLGITFVFFVGILLGHLRIPMDNDILRYSQNFGLIIFVYALGLQVGPGFFSSLKKSGLRLNMLALAVAAVGIVLTIVMSLVFDISIANMVGILCGAVTNTPALGAAQQAVISIPGQEPKAIADMALATAVTYPMGVVGVILAIIAMRRMLAPNEVIVDGNEKRDTDTYVGEFKITNPAIKGKTIKELMKIAPRKFVISRVTKGDSVHVAKSDTILELEDHLMVISIKSDVESIVTLLGEQVQVDWNKAGIDWNRIDNSQLVSRKIVVTKGSINGQKLGTLRIRNQYGVNITRIERVGIQLLASPDLALQIGDTLTIVGEIGEVDKVAKLIGDEIKRLKQPNLIAIFLGMALGLVLGVFPFPIPGMTLPIKLGIAGGPIIVGILMGAFGPRFKITTYTTQSANLFMRQFGLVTYLACLGIDAGEHFFETIFQPEGALWIGLGFALTVIPVLIVGFVSMKILHINFGKSVGMLCGSMANPIALNYVNSQTESDDPSVAYATVYPISMFVRIISAQILIMVLM